MGFLMQIVGDGKNSTFKALLIDFNDTNRGVQYDSIKARGMIL